MHTYQARWTCQCGVTGVSAVTCDHRGTASSMVVGSAFDVGVEHQRINGCEMGTVKISEHKEVK